MPRLDPKTASELISKSLVGQLDESESQLLQSHCEEDESTRRYAELSRAIHDSVAESTQPDQLDDSVRLSDAAKDRLRSSVRETLADDEAATETARGGDTTGDSPPAELVDDDEGEADSLQPNLALTETITPNATQWLPDGDEYREAKSRLKLLRKVGQGGLGAVWLARDERIKRTVAVKELNPNALENPKAWGRFLREAQITAHLEHPSIVPLYTYGEDAKTGKPFYAMRFVGKRSLADAIHEYHERREAGEHSEMCLHRLLVAFQTVCQAIAYAHSRGVIHRDLKPENVALNNYGQVVVLDWGLAKFLADGELSAIFAHQESQVEEDFAQTLDGEIVGTPLFMAPEQAAGELDSLNERTDVYGLGAILFAILTGAAPHELSCRSESGAINTATLLKAITEGETPSPRQRNASAPRDLADICMKAMAKKPHLRYASAEELANEIELWLAGQREKPRRYEMVRMEGRELRANVESMITDLSKNVRFMANLPPIQELIDAGRDANLEATNSWRDRLSQIFHGLLRTNWDYSAVTYYEVDPKSFAARELVRVERHSTDATNIRNVPASRLETHERSDFCEAVMAEKPEEVFVRHESAERCIYRTGRLAAGVPVFDLKTEEPFGYVAIECDLPRLLDVQIRQRVNEAKQLFLLDENRQVRLRHSQNRSANTCEKTVLDTLVPNLELVMTTVDWRDEYLDEDDHEVYAAKIALPGGKQSLTLIMLADQTPRNAVV